MKPTMRFWAICMILLFVFLLISTFAAANWIKIGNSRQACNLSEQIVVSENPNTDNVLAEYSLSQ